jgi:nucleoside-diphosphate-sugar epimerase
VKVFVTGASGVMGRSAISALYAAGHEVVGLARSTRAAEVVTARGAQPHDGHLFDREGMAAGMHGCDVVLNLATRVPVGTSALRPGAWRANDRIRTHGTAVVAAAARDAGVPRLVHQSLSFVYADHGDEWVDEHSSVDLTRALEHVVVAETHVDAFTRAGGQGVVLRFGLLAGPHTSSVWLLRRTRNDKPIGFGAPDSWTHLVHIDDVGTAAVAALGVEPGIYNVGAEPVKRQDVVDTYALVAERPQGRFYSSAATRLGGQRLEMITRSQRVSSQRFGDRTGWAPQYPKLTPDWFDGV